MPLGESSGDSHFEANEADIHTITPRGFELCGFVHTHPKNALSTPSDTDLHLMCAMECNWGRYLLQLIYAPSDPVLQRRAVELTDAGRAAVATCQSHIDTPHATSHWRHVALGRLVVVGANGRCQCGGCSLTLASLIDDRHDAQWREEVGQRQEQAKKKKLRPRRR